MKHFGFQQQSDCFGLIYKVNLTNTGAKAKQEMPQCDETRFSTLQPSIDMTGIRNERWQ